MIEDVDSMAGLYYAFATGIYTRTGKPHRSELPPEPQNWKEVQTHPHREGFIAAADCEYNSLAAVPTWKMVKRPAGRQVQVLPLKWVFTYKFDEDGYLENYKARICVRGDLQMMNELDTRATTLMMRTFRTFMALIAAFDLETRQYDAMTAFANSHLDELVYTDFPDGYKHPGMVLQLLRALYGLRRSPRLWQQEFSKTLEELGLHKVSEDPCLFVNNHIFLIFFVEDIIIAYRKDDERYADEFERALEARYKLKKMGAMQHYLGIRIIRDREHRKLWICQDAYIEKISQRFHLDGDQKGSPKTPLP